MLDFAIKNQKFQKRLKSIRSTNFHQIKIFFKPNVPNFPTIFGTLIPIITSTNPPGKLFGECPIDDWPSVTAVEAVIDSSRYFVLRLVDPKDLSGM